MKRLSFAMVIIIPGIIVSSISCVSKDVQVTETYYDTEFKTEPYSATDKLVTTSNGQEILTPKIVWYEPNIELKTTERTSERSYRGPWYLGYTLPKHHKSSIEISIRETDSLRQDVDWWYKFYGGKPSYRIRAYNLGVWVYDVSKVGHFNQPTVKMPIYTKSWPGSYDSPIYPTPTYPTPLITSSLSTWETQQAEEWMKNFNSQLNSATPLIELQETSSNEVSEAFLFKFDTTGVAELAIFVTGSKWAGEPVESLKLVWADEIITDKTVTKYRQVPIQVQKQRTVTQTVQVPFWEAIFSK